MSAPKRASDLRPDDHLSPPNKLKRNAFAEGAIVRIKLENFLTFESVEFNTSPYLNVIIGPNGTGKSSIICAICLGLAGKTSWLGRASQLSEFIHYGKQKGKIELELFNPDGDNYIIQREINKNNTSLWFVNGRQAAQKVIEEMTVRLNIQVGNLCQFLPQEKVADFSRMSPQELLESTERAVGTPEMYETHMMLKQARVKARNLENIYKNSLERCHQEKQKNDNLQQDVRNFEERQKYLEQIKMLRMKRPWLEYEEQRKKYTEVKKQRDETSEAVARLRTEAAPIQKKLDAIQTKITQIRQQMKTTSSCMLETEQQVASNTKEIEGETDKVTETLDDLKYKKQEEEQGRKKIRELKKQLAIYENQLMTLSTEEDNQPAIENTNRDIQQMSQQLHKLNTDKAGISDDIRMVNASLKEHVQSLQHLHDIAAIRLQTLRNLHKNTYLAVVWLRENKHLFKSTIHEPIMLQINMKNSSDAKFLENHISFNDLRSFVCEDADDMDLFLSKIRDEQKLKINCVKSPSKPLSQFQPKIPLAHLQRYGFHCFLKDLFDCPDAVMRFLYLQYRVHSIPVYKSRTPGNVDQIIRDNPKLDLFYTENNRFAIKTSVYSGHKSTKKSSLGDATILKNSYDTEKERWLQHEIKKGQTFKSQKEEDTNKILEEYQRLETCLNDLKKKKRELMQQKDTKRRLLSEIQAKKNRILHAESEAIDLVEEERKTKAIVNEISKRKIGILKKLVLNTEKCLQLSKKKVELSLNYTMATQNKATIEETYRETNHALQKMEHKLDECKENIKTVKDLAKKLLDVAQKATNTPKNEELSEYYRKEFEKYPTTIQEIDDVTHALQARADCRFHTEEKVVQEYYQRQKTIQNLEEEMKCKKVDVENHQQQIEIAKKQWLEPLSKLITKISRSFSEYFHSMDCAGEVDLKFPDNAEDFEKYGVSIKVKFRDSEQMQELSQNIQSGGERSISTVLYLMAIQDLATAPFRCVDEINQGMDPINERRVFKIVVDAVCKKRTSQYFLLTPKLLPDLDYHDAMSVLCVYNGPLMLHHSEWDLRKFLRRRRRLVD